MYYTNLWLRVELREFLSTRSAAVILANNISRTKEAAHQDSLFIISF